MPSHEPSPTRAELVRLVNQCLLVGMPGREPDAQFRAWLKEGLGGVLLFRDNIVDQAQVAGLVKELHTARPGLIVAADEEGGDITRLHARTGSPHPGNLALGAVDDVALTRAVAADIGAELYAAGIQLDLAPSADVNTDPDNPIIGTRSFGADPELVARHTIAYVAGLHDAGISASAKHFPGHGDTGVDTHLALPTITGDLEPHLRPFRVAIAAGVDAVLTTHILFPKLDPDRPATLSPRILTGLLREELGFRGAIITDSLSMAAITEHYGLAEGSLQAMLAGADLLCMNSELSEQLAVRDHLLAAVDEGRLPVDRLVAAANRVRALARQRAPRPHPSDRRWDTATARRALYVDGLTLPLSEPAYVVEVAAPRRGIEPTACSLLAMAQERDPRTEGVRLHAPEDGHPGDLDAALAAAGERAVVLVVRDAHRDPHQREIVERTLAARSNAILVGVGTTADSALAPGRYLGARSGSQVTLSAAADAMFGS